MSEDNKESTVVVEDTTEQTAENTETAKNHNTKESLSKSALQDNIEKKGKNAYYFAHAHKATGPKWDGKIEPKLLSRHSTSHLEQNDDKENTSSSAFSSVASLQKSMPSFDIHKSNIQKYAFLDDTKKVKIYIEMEGVGERCTNEDDISLVHTESSFCLIVKNYEEDEETNEDEEKCLSFGRLYGSIESASFKKKMDKIIITLVKKEVKEWSSIGAKGDE
uniref:CS domain-containing protein n=1 Tax=Helicotheca tamesis TaxID=374047 RepID=A0A7S2H6N3_9STRA